MREKVWQMAKLNFFGINYEEIDRIHGKIQFVQSIFDVRYTKICFLGLIPDGRAQQIIYPKI